MQPLILQKRLVLSQWLEIIVGKVVASKFPKIMANSILVAEAWVTHEAVFLLYSFYMLVKPSLNKIMIFKSSLLSLCSFQTEENEVHNKSRMTT